ncbi:hypothetical protein, partial [Moritella marina]|uniref:hypothetical protein n=1 Tax=Moritella marina TaxID=90736 RepID=UPI003703B1EA
MILTFSTGAADHAVSTTPSIRMEAFVSTLLSVPTTLAKAGGVDNTAEIAIDKKERGKRMLLSLLYLN